MLLYCTTQISASGPLCGLCIYKGEARLTSKVIQVVSMSWAMASLRTLGRP